MQTEIKTFLTEINFIKNKRYAKNLEILLSLVPSYFYEVPASSTGKYHPSFSLGEGGLVRHTKVAVRIAHELLNNDTVGYKFNNDEKDLIIISLIMHDTLKSGLEKEKYTRFDHPILAAKLIKDNKDKLDFTNEELEIITSSISSHMGQWNTDNYSSAILPLPKNKYARFVHMCDYLASRKFLDVKFNGNEIE
jgi:23S rRNA maturation-related 3'-5' exoribonuclease YhaM